MFRLLMKIILVLVLIDQASSIKSCFNGTVTKTQDNWDDFCTDDGLTKIECSGDATFGCFKHSDDTDIVIGSKFSFGCGDEKTCNRLTCCTIDDCNCF